MPKLSKHFKLREMQKRKEITLAEQSVIRKHDGDVPVHILWGFRAERLLSIRRGY